MLEKKTTCGVPTTLAGLLQKLQSRPTTHSELVFFIIDLMWLIRPAQGLKEFIVDLNRSCACLQARRNVISSSQTFKVLSRTKQSH